MTSLKGVHMKKVFAVTAAIMLLCMAGGSASAGWTVVNLHPAGALESQAHGVSGGQQVGYAQFGHRLSHAGLWSGTAQSWVELGGTCAWGVSGGQQVGEDYVGGIQAFLWSGTAESRMHLNPAGSYHSHAYGVSGGQQVGDAEVDYNFHASLWSGTAESWVDLNPAGSIESCAYGVSGGQQVGEADGHAGLWSGCKGSWVDLNPLRATRSVAQGISGGQQVGYAAFGHYPYDTTHAILWSGSAQRWVDLNPAGAAQSWAYGISGGQQAGYATIGDFNHAGLWNGTAKSWVDLHALLPVGVYSRSYANSIDVSGGEIWVAGSADNNAMLWHYTPDAPVPEPSSLIALGALVTPLLTFRRRRGK